MRLQIDLRIGQVVGESIPFQVERRGGPDADQGHARQQSETHGEPPPPACEVDSRPDCHLHLQSHRPVLPGTQPCQQQK